MAVLHGLSRWSSSQTARTPQDIEKDSIALNPNLGTTKKDGPFIDPYLEVSSPTSQNIDHSGNRTSRFLFAPERPRVSRFHSLSDQQDNASELSLDAIMTEVEAYHSPLSEPRNAKANRFSTISRFSMSIPAKDTQVDQRRRSFRESMFGNWKRKGSIAPPLLEEDSPYQDVAKPANRLSHVSSSPSSEFTDTRRNRKSIFNPLGTISELRQEKKDRRKTTDQQLLAAAGCGDVASVGLLISAGVNPCRCNPESGLYPVHQAVAGGHVGALRGLVEHGARIEVKNKAGRTPLHIAVLNEQKQMVQVLLKMGACIDEPDRFGLTPLHLAASMSDKLADGSATPTLPSMDNKRWSRSVQTPPSRKSLLARRSWSMPLVTTLPPDSVLETLIKGGADLDTVNERGDTPLHVAIKAGNSRHAKALIDAGASLSLKNKDGLTPVSVFTNSDQMNPDMLRLLIAQTNLGDVDEEPMDVSKL